MADRQSKVLLKGGKLYDWPIFFADDDDADRGYTVPGKVQLPLVYELSFQFPEDSSVAEGLWTPRVDGHENEIIGCC